MLSFLFCVCILFPVGLGPVKGAALGNAAWPNNLLLLRILDVVDAQRTNVVLHDQCGPWKHLLTRSGYMELVRVVMRFE